jgi:hypothetical protein
MEQDVTQDPNRLPPETLDYTSPQIDRVAAREDPTPWFGYIGIGIAIAAMLIGFAGMLLFALYFLNG